MNGLLADDADYVPFRRDEAQPLAYQYLGIPTANRRYVYVPVVIDVLDNDADLVDVPVKKDRRVTFRIDLRHGIAGDVDDYIVGECFCFGAPGTSGQRLEARRPWRVEQTLQKLNGGGV